LSIGSRGSIFFLLRRNNGFKKKLRFSQQIVP
jgi:hypothetical protein